ncbi:MAG TPA: hypothetical protein VEL76_03360 [Gemmataceae bacterium]|nr:hypothetical protein [Gemmataceae bacterium]
MAAPLRPSCSREELPPELIQLRTQIDQLSWAQQQKLLPLCEKVCQFVTLQGRLIRIAQEAVDQLHLDVKYLLFDLEVTRRERDELREELEEP